MRNLVLAKTLNTNVRKCFYSTVQTTKVVDKTTNPGDTTIDVKEVDNHAKLSDQWWNPNGGLRALHAMNHLRVPFVRDGLANTGVTGEHPSLPLDKIKILDIGCGGGILSEGLARIGADVTGVDASTELINIATQHAALDSKLSGRLKYIHSTIEEHSESNKEKYDAVVASEVLEHVADQDLFLKCCVAATKPGGSIFITTINKTMSSWLGGIIAAEYILKIIPLGTHQWNKFISPDETRRLIESYNCQTKLIHGSFFNPISNQWFWTSSTAIFYSLHAIKR